MRISASVGRISRLKRFLSMPKNRGASRKRTKRSANGVEDGGAGLEVTDVRDPVSMRSRSLTHRLWWTLADACGREQ